MRSTSLPSDWGPLPTVAGFVGDAQDAEVALLEERLPAPVEVVFRSSVGTLLTSRPLRRWSAEAETGWFWGQDLEHGSPVHRWETVARDLGSAGFVTGSSGEVRLHADLLGLIPVFVRELSEGVAFATRIDPLVPLGGLLSPDPQAWAEIVAGGMVMSDRTPFAEIRRLAGGQALVGGERGFRWERSLEPYPAVSLRRGDETAASDLLDSMAAAVERVRAPRFTIPLSGGWDSRLLAALATASDRPRRTITASEQFGRAEEAEWAAQVAERLGLENRQLPLPADAWHAFHESAERQDFLTSKNDWLLPVAQSLTEFDGTVLDGLAGDAVVKMNLPSGLADASESDIVLGIRDRFAPRLEGDEFLGSAASVEVDRRVVDRFRQCWEVVRLHRAALHVFNLTLRTATGVGLSPTMLLGSVSPIATPFLDPEVLSVALSVDPRDKRGGAWYRLVFEQLDPDLRDIPSTNDTRIVKRLVRRTDIDGAMLAGLRDTLTDEVVRHAVGPRLWAAVLSGSVTVPSHVPELRIVRGLALYTLWARRYRERLHDASFPLGRDGGSRPHRVTVSPKDELDSDLPDRSWLSAQLVGKALPIRLGSDTAVIDREYEFAVDRGAWTVLLVGWPASHAELEAVLEGVRGCLGQAGRVVVSLGFPQGRVAEGLPGVTVVCEQLANALDLIHVQSSARRLRVIGRPVRTLDDRMAPYELSIVALSGVERRAHELQAELARLRDDARTTDVAAARARANLELLADERAELARALSEAEEDLAKLRRRRALQFADALGHASRSPAQALRLPGQLLRALRRHGRT